MTDIIKESEAQLSGLFARIDEIAAYNQEKVLEAFRKNRIAARHFLPSTGYGYGDDARDALGQVFADAFGAEAGIVSPHLLSGTHTLTVGLFGLLRPGDTMLCVSGLPYDTLRGVIFGEGNGSLRDFGIRYAQVDLADGKFDFAGIERALAREKAAMVYIQRSRGYELRDAFTVSEIGAVCDFVRKLGFSGPIFVDNCYGEFTELREPTEVGADLIAGSLIKNPGGGLAVTGGYLCGKRVYLDRIAERLTAPSIGAEVGSYAYGYQWFYQGFFLAPHVTAQALKGSLLIGKCMELLGYENFPKITDMLPSDITRAIRFPTEEELCGFIRSVQEASPVDSFVTPEPWEMPGYDSKVIMAAGCFVGGASIELSADAPVRAPYTAYFQGGLTYEHCKCALKRILARLNRA